MKKFLSIPALLGTFLLAGMLAAPAQANPETLPSSQHLFALDSADHVGMVWKLDTATGAAVKVGTSNGAPNTDFTGSAVDAAGYDPVSKKNYFIVEDQNSHQALFSVNLIDGISTFVALISNTQDMFFSLAVDNSGHAWVFGHDSQGGEALVNLDLTSGAVSNQNAVSLVLGDFWFKSLACDSKNSAMYLFKTDKSTGNTIASTINMLDGSLTQKQEFASFPSVPSTLPQGNPTGDFFAGPVVFDDNGIAWLLLVNRGTGVSGGSSTAITTWNPATQTLTPHANTYDPSGATYSWQAHEFYVGALLLSRSESDATATKPSGGKPVAALKVGKKLQTKTLAKKLGFKLTKKSKITVTIAKASKRYCKIVKANLVGVKKGVCTVNAKVTTGKSKSSKSGVVTITK